MRTGGIESTTRAHWRNGADYTCALEEWCRYSMHMRIGGTERECALQAKQNPSRHAHCAAEPKCTGGFQWSKNQVRMRSPRRSAECACGRRAREFFSPIVFGFSDNPRDNFLLVDSIEHDICSLEAKSVDVTQRKQL